ncbi:MAG: hypothetical protein EPN75_09205 [Beijerinckiaceae bacterium]|nr:MAG: hypothetical protein EPN75_09205 [Beijerinckiaceae bacterium]
MKQALKFGTAAILLISICAPAMAADDRTLVRILARADMAQDLAFYCAQYDPSIIAKTKSSVGDVQALMLHIRSEVTSGLPETEAARVVLLSATAARNGALRAVRKLYGQDPRRERARLASWCETFVVPLVREFAAMHDQHHEMIDQAIERAKGSPGIPSGTNPSQRD